MKVKLRTSFIVSATVHLTCLILILLLGGGQGKNQPKSQDDKKQGEGQHDFTSIIPMNKPHEDIEMQIDVPKKGDLVVKAEPQPSATPIDCRRWYGGIGIEYGSYGNTDAPGTVVKVPYGYPAQQAGIQVGDVVLPAEDPDIRGPVGTPVKIYVIRGEFRQEMTLIRGKICQEDITPSQPTDFQLSMPNYSTPMGGP